MALVDVGERWCRLIILRVENWFVNCDREPSGHLPLACNGTRQYGPGGRVATLCLASRPSYDAKEATTSQTNLQARAFRLNGRGADEKTLFFFFETTLHRTPLTQHNTFISRPMSYNWQKLSRLRLKASYNWHKLSRSRLTACSVKKSKAKLLKIAMETFQLNILKSRKLDRIWKIPASWK